MTLMDLRFLAPKRIVAVSLAVGLLLQLRFGRSPCWSGSGWHQRPAFSRDARNGDCAQCDVDAPETALQHVQISRAMPPLVRQVAWMFTGGLLGVMVALASSGQVAAADGSSAGAQDAVGMYFGNGCFWHVQKEFLNKETQALERYGTALTSLVGYAGGPVTTGNVCYHNASGEPDYSDLGYAEVVNLTVPQGLVGDFVKFHLDEIEKFPTPRSGPFRNVIGLPGGVSSPLYAAVEKANAGRAQLVAGTGLAEAARPGDAGAAGSIGGASAGKVIYVYDTAKFPFKPAEVYHQFIGDNVLKAQMLEAKRISTTGCPENPTEDLRTAAAAEAKRQQGA
eukprot:TRINITY_DN39967_c0_g1_i1.p1 TRINITY_DN39967_c0_g1~~TRINITY_DN39967_c0_g1_i1.p1  ORF type:complete len:337 (-),score=44.09 TRINITY_DN39967_c0_g1_i1:167-1177(-)